MNHIYLRRTGRQFVQRLRSADAFVQTLIKLHTQRRKYGRSATAYHAVHNENPVDKERTTVWNKIEEYNSFHAHTIQIILLAIPTMKEEVDIVETLCEGLDLLIS